MAHRCGSRCLDLTHPALANPHLLRYLSLRESPPPPNLSQSPAPRLSQHPLLASLELLPTNPLDVLPADIRPLRVCIIRPELPLPVPSDRSPAGARPAESPPGTTASSVRPYPPQRAGRNSFRFWTDEPSTRSTKGRPSAGLKGAPREPHVIWMRIGTHAIFAPRRVRNYLAARAHDRGAQPAGDSGLSWTDQDA